MGRLFTTECTYLSTYPPTAPAANFLQDTAPALGTLGYAMNRHKQTVSLPGTNPTTCHHTRPPAEHRAPTTPPALGQYPPLRRCPAPDSLPAHLQKPRLYIASSSYHSSANTTDGTHAAPTPSP